MKVTDTRTRVLVVADTHLSDGQGSRLLDRLSDAIDLSGDLEAIFHAGDIVHMSVLRALREIAPVHAVLGNNDIGLPLPEQARVDVAGYTIAMVHDSGPSSGRDRRLRRMFPTADVVLFGHSHIPWHETHVDGLGAHAAIGHVQHHVNPGSAMQRRSQPRCTVALLDLAPGQINVEIVPVG